MAVTIKKIETLKRDYIEASDLYYKVINLDTTKKQITLTAPFSQGSKATGKWTSTYNDKVAKIDHQYWNIIKANSKEAKGIESKLKNG